MRTLPGRLVLLGHPVEHSLSPRFQNAALRAAAFPLRYEAIDVAPADLPAVAAQLAAQGGAGNVTVPHKLAFAELCAERTPLAERAGAVNTFWTRADGGLVGDNTDVGGVHAAVHALLGVPPTRTRVTLLGAGGAAAAVCAAAESWRGDAMRCWSRRPAQARTLAHRFDGTVEPVLDLADAVRGATLIINATTLGMADDAFPVPFELLAPDAALLDLVYRRGETPWVRAARARGHRALDGLPMLLAQGALAFERWFGVAPDEHAMRQSLG
ncbi:MAG: shikimate dehydrogenase [Gemmatimonadetes bacterium]|nr:shikimate dehydrogenase [Gemmatimonadota bacterium]